MQEWAAGLKDEGREGVSREFQGSGGLTGSAMEPAGSQPGVVREMGSIPNSTMQDMLHTSPVSPGTASLPRLVAILQLQSKGSPQHQQRDLLSIDKSTATSPGAKSHAQPTPDLGALIIHTARDFVGTEKEGGGGSTISSADNFVGAKCRKAFEAANGKDHGGFQVAHKPPVPLSIAGETVHAPVHAWRTL